MSHVFVTGAAGLLAVIRWTAPGGGKGTLGDLRRTKTGMVDALRDGPARLMQFQDAVTLGLILAAEPLLRTLGLGALQTLNFGATAAGLTADERWCGLGFTAAAVGIVLGGFRVERAWRLLEYQTFTQPPVYSERTQDFCILT